MLTYVEIYGAKSLCELIIDIPGLTFIDKIDYFANNHYYL